jgi:UDP-3-O-[3-hydroxymyristoyl] glucosamine N-acyltransferase
VTWDGVVRLRGESLESLAARHGGYVASSVVGFAPTRLVPVARAGSGDLAPLLVARSLAAARDAAVRGAALLVDRSLADRVDLSGGARATERPGAEGSEVRSGSGGAAIGWVHEYATWAMAALLDEAIAPDLPAAVGAESSVAPTAVLGPRVVVGARVRIGAGAVIGHPGFGWATGPSGALRAVPQLGGVIIEDDVSIGPLCTVDAGTLSPTRIRRGVKLDAHVHVGHNADIGEGTLVAAQCGFAGSVTVGRDVRVGGQAGIADHVRVGDGAQIAAKSGVIADVPAGAIVAGYPAVRRSRWLRALAQLYRGVPR